MLGTQVRIDQHQQFWEGRGPCLILIPAERLSLYDTDGYARRFENPELMWEAEMRRARRVVDWPTDGIPTIRPNLGVVFIPGIAGQDCVVEDGAMPWPGKPLPREAIRNLGTVEVSKSKLMRLAAEFFQIHHVHGGKEIVSYQPDTQGVFSLAHLLNGEATFYEVVDDKAWMHELLEAVLALHRGVMRCLKSCLQEPDSSMVHGHGTPQGVYFPHAGLRTADDTATLLSPAMIDEFVMPYLERSVAPFGGTFAHFCGRHTYMFEQFCRRPWVRAIDLGNPEFYDTRWLLEKCAETGTVLCSAVAAEEGEEWPKYIRRLAGLVRETGARVILRPAVFPETREDCARMRDLWHELTS